jgi:ribosome biogenesis protein Tsr3
LTKKELKKFQELLEEKRKVVLERARQRMLCSRDRSSAMLARLEASWACFSRTAVTSRAAA